MGLSTVKKSKECKNYTCWLVGDATRNGCLGWRRRHGSNCGTDGVLATVATFYILDLVAILKTQYSCTNNEVSNKKTWHDEAQTPWGQFWDHIWSPELLKNISMNIFSVFNDLHTWGKSWPHQVYIWLCQALFFENLGISQIVTRIN